MRRLVSRLLGLVRFDMDACPPWLVEMHQHFITNLSNCQLFFAGAQNKTQAIDWRRPHMRLRADRREERKREADSRNEAWRQLSRREQLESLNNRPGKSAKQRKILADGGE